MILTKLLLAHLIGDFLLQPDSWVADKEQKKIRSYKLLYHWLIHLGLMLLLLWDLQWWLLALLITILHLLMDIIKLYFQNDNTRRKWFFIDQAVHVLVILTAVAVFGSSASLDYLAVLWSSQNFWVVLTAVVFLSFPSAHIIKMSISRWAAAIPNTPGADDDSLASAGKIIGILERLFVLVLVLAGQWQAVGFLLAAKSVFRFGDLREMRDRKLTEYVLIGTLMSFGIALLTGMVAFYFIAG